jgi:hypothetical protein
VVKTFFGTRQLIPISIIRTLYRTQEEYDAYKKG